MTEVLIQQLTQPTLEGYVLTREMFKQHLAPNSEFQKSLKDGKVFGYFAINSEIHICAKFNSVFISDGYLMGVIEPTGLYGEALGKFIEEKQPIRFHLIARFTPDPSQPMGVAGIHTILGFMLDRGLQLVN